MILHLLQLVGTVGGLVGALLVSTKRPLAGSLCWACTNLCWVIFGWMTSNYYIVVMFSAYHILAAIGIWQWWPKKAKKHLQSS